MMRLLPAEYLLSAHAPRQSRSTPRKEATGLRRVASANAPGVRGGAALLCGEWYMSGQGRVEDSNTQHGDGMMPTTRGLASGES